MATDQTVSADPTDYPTSDGRPMAETDLHRDLMVELIDTLRGYYADRPDMYVSGNLMVYYVPGNRRKFLAPDCFVVFGVPKHDRELYKVWEEGRFPSVVFELTSKSTESEDVQDKLAIYRDVWRVDEYFLFDPRAEYLHPPLQGYRRVDGELTRIEPLIGGVLFSPRLGLLFRPAGSQLLLMEGKTGRMLHTPARQLAIDEGRRRQEAEAARQQAEAARQQAEAAAAAERTAREAADDEIARLRAELAALRQPPAPDA